MAYTIFEKKSEEGKGKGKNREKQGKMKRRDVVKALLTGKVPQKGKKCNSSS